MTDRSDLWDLMEDNSICMVTTDDEGTLRSRPMAARVDTDSGTIRFVTSRTAAKVEELHHGRDVNVSFANVDDHSYVSLSGKGSVTTDRNLIKELWGPYCEMWFEGDAETADVAVITVHPSQAEYWDNTSGKIVTAYEFAKSYFTSETPDVGVNKKVDL